MQDFTLYLLFLAACLVLSKRVYSTYFEKKLASSVAICSDSTQDVKQASPPQSVPLNVTFETARPTPYRPFRYGPKYAVNMGIRALHLDQESWIEVDNHFHRFHRDKLTRLSSEHGGKLWGSLPGSEDACREVFEMLAEYLPARYPKIYRQTPRGMSIEGCEEVIFDQHPLVNASKLVQDDLAIMQEGPDGQYYLKAGSILLAGFWKLQDKLGMPLSEIHTSGDVPHYQEKLQSSMNRYFSRLKVDRPIVRNNYFIQNDAELPWSTSIGPEFGGHAGWDTASSVKSVDQLYFRSERQSLRRLPRSKAILFTIRTYFHPITEIAKDPNVPGRLASAVRSWDDKVREYKGADKYEAVLLPYLDECHRQQVSAGITVDEEVEYKYPF